MLEVTHVSHEYSVRGRTVLPILRDLSFRASRGEILSLIGPSACGKSTLLRIIAGLVQPRAGSVVVEGGSIASARKSHAISMVFQDPALVPWRSTLANVMMPGEISGFDAKTRRRKSVELLELVGLSGFENFEPKQLSGGMRQRAAIARSLLLEPRLLLMDEPLGALDQLTRERLQTDLLTALSPSSCTVILVTHDISEAVFMSDRVMVLTPAPASIAGMIEVHSPRPRGESFRTTKSFFGLCCAVRELLQSGGATRDKIE